MLIGIRNSSTAARIFDNESCTEEGIPSTAGPDQTYTWGQIILGGEAAHKITKIYD